MGDNCCSSLLGSHEQGFQEDKGRFAEGICTFVREKGKDTKGMGIKKGVPLYSNLC